MCLHCATQRCAKNCIRSLDAHAAQGSTMPRFWKQERRATGTLCLG